MAAPNSKGAYNAKNVTYAQAAKAIRSFLKSNAVNGYEIYSGGSKGSGSCYLDPKGKEAVEKLRTNEDKLLPHGL